MREGREAGVNEGGVKGERRTGTLAEAGREPGLRQCRAGPDGAPRELDDRKLSAWALGG